MYKQMAPGQRCEKQAIKYLPLNPQPFIDPNPMQSSGCDLRDALGCLNSASYLGTFLLPLGHSLPADDKMPCQNWRLDPDFN